MILDLTIAFDQRMLDEKSRDLITIQTSLETFRLHVISMRYTNSLQIMHDAITFILSKEIPDHALSYVDDVLSFNEFMRYELNDESFETILENSRIQRFI